MPVAVHAPRTSASPAAAAPRSRAPPPRLGHVNLGHFLPDYTAYEELLDIFKAFTAIPILLEGERGYAFTADDLRREILGRGLSALLLSNPCNPTGKLVHGDELARWVRVARELDCALLIDEFYSHYIWTAPARARCRWRAPRATSRTSNRDPVVIFDGLTKNWRYPGWRVTWTVGPAQVIDAVASAGSFLDGGGSQAAAARGDPAARGGRTCVAGDARDPRRVPREARPDARAACERLGVRIDRAPDGTFYVWGNVASLPPPLNDGMGFFRAALEQKVITVPGEFFDVNPGKRRSRRASRFRSYVRFSFGAPQAQLDEALVADRAARPVENLTLRCKRAGACPSCRREASPCALSGGSRKWVWPT